MDFNRKNDSAKTRQHLFAFHRDFCPLHFIIQFDAAYESKRSSNGFVVEQRTGKNAINNFPQSLLYQKRGKKFVGCRMNRRDKGRKNANAARIETFARLFIRRWFTSIKS
jgi:hypothetical protein